MATPSLFPTFMNPLAVASGGAVTVVVALVAEPDITVDADTTITAEASPIVVEVEPDIEIEVE